MIMARACWTWCCPLVENIGEMLKAYFSGLPEFPYRSTERGAYRSLFSRGSLINAWFTGGSWQDMPTTLTVTHRPNRGNYGENTIEWSFIYDYNCGGIDAAAFLRCLEDELKSFQTYCCSLGRIQSYSRGLLRRTT